MLKHSRALASYLSLTLLASSCATDVEQRQDDLDVAADDDGMHRGYIPGPDGEYMEVRYELRDGVAVLDGDMRIDPLPAPPKKHMRAAMIKGKNWTGGVVPYEIGPGFDAARTNEIREAVKDWNENTPFWFTPRNGQADYVVYVNSTECRSDIGKTGGRQEILVGTGCGTAETIHEMGHAVGFFHEQSRQDRDNFVNIDFANVKDGKKGNFDKYLATNGEDYGPYQVESIMHYPALITDAAFVKDTGKNTITRKDGTTWVSSSRLTGLDRAAAYRRADFMEPLKQKWLDFQWAIGFGLDKPLLTADKLGRFLPAEWGRVYVHLLQPDPVVVYGMIYQKFLEYGADTGFLGRPLTDELGTPDGIGRYNHFAGGSIYWSPNSGAHTVYGSIRDKWAELGWETSFLGYPVTDELGTPDGVGRYNHFEGGSIYWTAQTGAHLVYGSIRDKWAELGWETQLGYPITDELPLNDGSGGRYSKFQFGTIKWTPAAGAWVVWKVVDITPLPHVPFCTFTVEGCP